MGVRSWFASLLGRGEEPDRDADEQIEVPVVPLAQGPMLVAALQRADIDAVGIESVDVATETRSKMRILVRRADAECAHEVLDGVL